MTITPMTCVALVLLGLALFCFVRAAGNSRSRYNLVALGLACWVLLRLLQVVVSMTH